METTLANPLDPTAAAAAASPLTAAAPTLGRDDFLRLLIAQLENQNPLEPAKDTEFIAQLATFSGLEQQILTNDRLESIAVGQASLINSQALELLGKDALVEAGDEIRVNRGQAEQLVYAVPRPASSATLTIYASDNTALRVIELEPNPAGRIDLDWDGLDNAGNPVADGTYRIEVNATDLEGKPLPVALFKSLPIDGVIFDTNGIFLVSGDRELPYDQIIEIRAG